MIHKYGPESYPKNKDVNGVEGVYQNNDGEINVVIQVKNPYTGALLRNYPVYFRVFDPADLSAYAASFAHADDNVGGSKTPMQPALLAGNGLTLEGTNPPTWKAVSNETGTITITLQIPGSTGNPASASNPAASPGDNYRVVASFWPDFRQAENSGTITAWRRIYVEQDKMFRNGALLKRDALGPGNGLPGDNIVIIYKWASSLLPRCGSTAGKNACFQIALFDSAHPLEGIHERMYVSHITQDLSDSAQDLVLHLVRESKAPFSPYEIQNDYLHSPYPSFASGVPLLISGRSAGIGVVGSTYYQTDPIGLSAAYADAFVEFELAATPGPATMPYLPPEFFNSTNVSERVAKNRSAKFWFSNCGTNAPPGWDWTQADWDCAENNFFHLLGIANTTNTNWGQTQSESNESWVYTGKIESVTGSTALSHQFTVAHEFGHQFETNRCFCSEHDLRLAWCASTSYNNCGLGFGTTQKPVPAQKCLMSFDETTLKEREDGVNKFDTIDLITGVSEYIQLDCDGDGFIDRVCAPGDTAIRTAKDPL